jgi:hypothetical protein
MFYQIESGENKKIVKKNREMAEGLKDGYGYAYKVGFLRLLFNCN